MKVTSRMIVTVSILLSFLSCRQLVTDNFEPIPAMPVFNSIIIPGKTISAHLSWVAAVNADKIEPIEDARVELFVDGVFAETLTYSGGGIYKAGIKAQPERTYRYEVAVPGYEHVVTAECFAPRAEQLIEVKHIEKAGIDYEGFTYPALKFTFTNNITRAQYYEAIIALDTGYGVRNAELENIVDPLIVNEGLPIAVFSNTAIKESRYEMTLYYRTGSITNNSTKLYPLVLEFRTLSPEYYKFARQSYLYENGRFPDGLASGNDSFQLYSNVTNGYGIVAAYSAAKSATIYPSGE